MSIVNIEATINAKWLEGHSSYSPCSPEELAIIGIELLVRELGTDVARKFILQAFERYPNIIDAGLPTD